jgi:hypothetical protein
VAAGKKQLGRCAAEQGKFNRLYLYSGKVTFTVMYLRRALGVAAQNLGLGRCRGKTEPFWAVYRHKHEVNDFACGTLSRRGPPAALPRAGVWHALCDGAHCPCAARNAANDKKSIDVHD